MFENNEMEPHGTNLTSVEAFRTKFLILHTKDITKIILVFVKQFYIVIYNLHAITTFGFSAFN